jgi:hypothetical protein
MKTPMAPMLLYGIHLGLGQIERTTRMRGDEPSWRWRKLNRESFSRTSEAK